MKDVYPTLFRLSSHKNAIVADLWGRGGGGGGCWEVSFRRPFQDWELKEVSWFLEHISPSKVQEGEDTLIWKNDGKGKYNVKSYCISLRTENNLLFPAKEVWGLVAPLKTRFFAWKAVWEKILTVDMLMKRGWSLVNRCSLCKDSEKSVDHISIHCDRTRQLWILLLTTFGLVWVFLAWFQFVYFGVFGGSTTEGFSKTKN